ncbi:MAG: flagellar biosynthesis protein FlhA, partial [Rickettsiales bacterium]
MSDAAPQESSNANGASTPQGGGGAPFQIPELLKRGDIALALGVIAILVVLLLPMPTWLLDFSLAISITFSVVILMTVLFIKNPLELNTFPTILLIATMLRLSLNLASTRLILAEGHTGPSSAGRVIEAFGNFVVGGNYIIGIIVFGILVIVNFVVITKGAGRIAEVAARFSLDAMPGKQMAIDADLSSGLIGEEAARKRRSELEQENSFFGAMDGASKFVRGDAVAGLLITFINIVGGIIIGTAQQNMSLANAAETYTLLTVGDGLVTQIPALIVSTAAGMLVTRSGVQGAADEAVLGQLTNYPIALTLATGLLLTIAVLPGIPAFPFLMIAAITGVTAYMLNAKIRREEDEVALAEVEKKTAPPPEEPIGAALQIDNIRLELGYGLLSLINNPSERRLTEQIKALRRQLAGEMGFIMPAVRIQDNLQLPPNNYILRVKEIESGNGELRPNMLLVMDPRGEQIALPGETTVEPTFGLPAMWVGEQHREEAMFRGLTVVDAPTVITTH